MRKLDPPVRAALRLGAYQLGYSDTAAHAAVNESVELVRRARLERAVPFTNAVMRRLSDGIGPLLESLPDGPLKESYPDWIHEVFVRVLGEDGALALMRAMNEPLETVVRLVRGESPTGAEETDVPGAYRVERVVEALVAEGRIWPQSRGSQLAGLCVGSQDGERVLDLCAAPGGKTGQLRGEVTAVEIDPARARELRENLARMGRPTSRSSRRTARCSRRSSTATTARSWTRRARSRRARPAARPPLAREPAPRPPARAASLRRRARAARRHDPLLGLHAEPGRVRGGRRRERPRVLPLGEEWPAFAHPSRPEFLLTLPHVHGTSGFFIARLARD